jgi:hypothetical protein
MGGGLPIEGGVKVCNLGVFVLAGFGCFWVLQVLEVERAVEEDVPCEVVFGYGCEFAASEFEVNLGACFFDEGEVAEVTEEVIELSVGQFSCQWEL